MHDKRLGFGLPGFDTITVETDERVVKAIVAWVMDAFNDYLVAHAGTPLPEAFMAAVNVFRIVVADQADQMGLSPEQRESYNEAARATLHAALGADLTRARAVALAGLKATPARTTARTPKPKPKKE